MAEIEVIAPEVKAALRRFLELRDKKDETDAAAKAAKKDHDDAELELYDTLKEGIAGTLKVDLGEPYGVVSFLPQESKKANVINERKLTQWLEDSQMLDEFSNPILVRGRLNELVRTLDEQQSEYPPGLEKFTKRYVRVTRPKGGK